MSICWIHKSILYKCQSCKLVHCKYCHYYPCKLKIYFWKCCNIEHKLINSNLKIAKIDLEKHESKIHKSKKVGTFGFYVEKD